MMSHPRTRASVQAPFGGVTDWYPEPRLWQLCCTEGGAAAVASPAGVLELDTHSSSEADPVRPRNIYYNIEVMVI
ncbi:hypothetical protein Tco_0965321 [Tanacetum coccineum]